MLSIVLFIATAVALLAGIAYFIFTYAPYVIEFFNDIVGSYSIIVDALPDWLLPYALVPLIFAVVGFLIKVL